MPDTGVITFHSSWAGHTLSHSAVGELRAGMDNGPFALLFPHSQVCQVTFILRDTLSCSVWQGYIYLLGSWLGCPAPALESFAAPVVGGTVLGLASWCWGGGERRCKGHVPKDAEIVLFRHLEHEGVYVSLDLLEPLGPCLVSSSLCSHWLVCPAAAAVRLVQSGSMWCERCWQIRRPCCWNLLLPVTVPAAAGGWGWPVPPAYVRVSLPPCIPFCMSSHSLCILPSLFSVPVLHLLLHFICSVYIAVVQCWWKVLGLLAWGYWLFMLSGQEVNSCVPPHLGERVGFLWLLFLLSLERNAEGSL